MKILLFCLRVPLLMIGLIIGLISLSEGIKRLDFNLFFAGLRRDVFSDVKTIAELPEKLRQFALSKFITKTIIAMSAWLKKVEDKAYALVGGAGIFISEELPVI